MSEVAAEVEPRRHRRSASQLEGYLRCGEAYRLERIVKAPQWPAAWLTQGIAFHDAVEKWEATGRTATVQQAQMWYAEAWDKTYAEQIEQEPQIKYWLTGGRTKPEDDIERRFQRGMDQVAEYIAYALATANEWHILDLGGGNLACEIPFDITLNGVRIIGYIDQIIEFADGGLLLRDLKTGTKLPDSPRQLGIYRVATSLTLGLDIDWGDFFMSKNGAPTKPYDLSRFTPERVGRWFTDLDESVEQGRFIPNPGDHCRICAVSRFCDFNGRDAHLYPIEFKETAA